MSFSLFMEFYLTNKKVGKKTWKTERTKIETKKKTKKKN